MTVSLPGEYALPDPPTPEEAAAAGQPEPELSDDEKIRLERQQALVSIGLPTKAITAFVVMLTEDGTWIGNSNLVGHVSQRRPDGSVETENLGTPPPLDALEIKRPATLQEMIHGALIVREDAGRALAAEVTAMTIQQRMMAQAAQMAQQQEASRILQQVQGKNGLTGPNGRPVR